MNSSYKLRINPAYGSLSVLNVFAQQAPPKLTSNSLARAFAGAVVRQFAEYGDGSYVVEIDLPRQSHAQALNEIVNVLVRAGFQVGEVQVTEWTTSWMEGAIAGAIGGGAIGTGIASVAGLIFGALIGAEVGAVGGMFQRKVIRTFDAVQNQFVQGGWQLTVRRPEVAPLISPRPAY